MTETIYNAFVEAGLEKEADRLSTTITDKDGNQKKVSGLGHYIAILDSHLDKNYDSTKDHLFNLSLDEAKDVVGEYLNKNRGDKESLWPLTKLLNSLTK